MSDLAENIEKKRTDKCHHRYARLFSLNVFSGTILRIFFLCQFSYSKDLIILSICKSQNSGIYSFITPNIHDIRLPNDASSIDSKQVKSFDLIFEMFPFHEFKQI